MDDRINYQKQTNKYSHKTNGYRHTNNDKICQSHTMLPNCVIINNYKL